MQSEQKNELIYNIKKQSRWNFLTDKQFSKPKSTNLSNFFHSKSYFHAEKEWKQEEVIIKVEN